MKKIILAIGIVLSATSASAMSEEEVRAGFKKYGKDATMEYVAEHISKKLPMQLDRDTMATRVSYVLGKLIHESAVEGETAYRFKNLTSEEVSIVVAEMKAQQINRSCTTPSTRAFLYNDITLKYKYYHITGEYIGGYEVSKDSCVDRGTITLTDYETGRGV